MFQVINIIKKAARPILCSILAISFVLAGFPSEGLIVFIKEKNIIDPLYWAEKNSNSIDTGFAYLLKPEVERAHAANFSIQSGYYIGNAVDNRQITGIGFQPDLVLLKDNTAAGSDGLLFRTSVMTAERTAKLGEAEADLTTNAIQSIISDGFTIGTSADVNSSAVMHYWTAFGGSDCSSSGNFCVGSYTGNGTSQNVTSVGFQPDLVIVKRSGASAAIWKNSSMAANASNYFSATLQDTGSQMITTFLSNGFGVGNNAAVNTSANTYWYIAFKQTAGVMDVGTYTGSGVDNRNITSTDDAGLTFRPNFVFVKPTTAVTAVFSQSEHYGDRSYLPTDAASAVNHIQELRTAGGFQVGTSTSVNTSGNTLFYAAFGGASPKSAGSGTYSMKTGSYTGTGTGFSVTGLGFAPDLVTIKHTDQATDQYAVFRTRMMIGDLTSYYAPATAPFAGGITALGTDGFTIGTAAPVNTSADTYYWTAYGNAWKPDVSGGAADFMIGAYIGDGIDNRNIDRLPFQPDFVAIKHSGTGQGTWRTSSMTGDVALLFSATVQTANIIQAFNSDGFQRGTNASSNTASGTYFYYMFDEGSRFDVGSYTGNGTSQNITTVGFQPDNLWIKKASGGTARAGLLRLSDQIGNIAQPFMNLPSLVGEITNLLSGGFAVGAGTGANESAGVYQYAAWDYKQYEQSAYRFFDNANSADVGVALGATNTPVTQNSLGDIVRLRMLLHVTSGNLISRGQDFKLQYVDKGAGSCASPSGSSPSSYTDVTSSTLIKYADNSSVVDNAVLTANGNDPTHSGHSIVNQTYEEANNFTNTEGAIFSGQDGKWDFSLVDNGAPASTTYCFRVVESDDTVLSTYSQYPELTTGGNSVPSLTFSISDNTIGFGALSSSAARYATGALTGSGSETEAHTMSASSNAGDGYFITINGSTLEYSGNEINSIGCSNISSSVGTEQFGIRMSASGGTGVVQAPYAASGFAFCHTDFPDAVASGAGDNSTTVYSARYLANISSTTPGGEYDATLTYLVTGGF